MHSQSTLEDANPVAAPAALCPSCAHPLDLHDVIGRRFCLATAATGSDRNCVCAVDATTAGTRSSY